MKILKEIKNSPFKPLKRKLYVGKIVHGTPYFHPRNFIPTIIRLRRLHLSTQEELDKLSNPWQKEAKKYKNMPMVRRSWDKVFTIFGYHFWFALGWPVSYREVDLGWKDKWSTPRYEWGPMKAFYFFKWQICLFYKTPESDRAVDTYWEMFLWWKYYSSENLDKAESTWGWVDSRTSESTWDKSLLK
jgi:hypothetical protein